MNVFSVSFVYVYCHDDDYYSWSWFSLYRWDVNEFSVALVIKCLFFFCKVLYRYRRPRTMKNARMDSMQKMPRDISMHAIVFVCLLL